jgi:hypothetical protein
MNAGHLRFGRRIGGVFIVMQSLVAHAPATTVEYSWSGTIVPNGQDDPWAIGAIGKPFDLSFGLATSATDLANLDLESAIFAVNSAKVLIDGADLDYVGGGTANFTVNTIGLYDFLQFVGVFERLGTTLEFGSVVVFPQGTFDFSQFVEPPPRFASTLNFDQSAYGGHSPYGEIVVGGTLVSVSAEPSTATLLLAGVVAMLVVARTTRRSARRDQNPYSGSFWSL